MTETVFADRHMGIDGKARAHMLATIGFDTLEELVQAALPSNIRQSTPLALESARSEAQMLRRLRGIAAENKPHTSLIGQGYYGTITPAVIQRTIIQNPAWYTSYTPYQPEISQGRLEALLNFQTMISDLCALPVANASLLDEATAVAEAVSLMCRSSRSRAGFIVLDADLFPQTLAVVQGRARAAGFEVRVLDVQHEGLPEGELIGAVLQQPGSSGKLYEHAPVIAEAKRRGALVTVAADILSLTIIVPPGEQGADIAVGSTQRFGVPLFFGGPHAAYMAVREGLERGLPGRLVGVSHDDEGTPAFRLALQTREQHIRRERATSNICTAQALLAIVASMYAAYHGPEGLRAIGERVHRQALHLARSLKASGSQLHSDQYFDTLLVRAPGRATRLLERGHQAGVNLRFVDADTVGVSVDETTDEAVLETVAGVFEATLVPAPTDAGEAIPPTLRRSSTYLNHPVFHHYRSETQLMRYARRLADRDLALDRTMIPLGSCTMKLNAAAEMEALTWPEFANTHPFAPAWQTAGWRRLIEELEADLASITGFHKVSIQPNAGSQGELAGLLAIRAYHVSRGETSRNVCLIPTSAHGTNAASAALAGMKVVVVATGQDGGIDCEDLKAKLAEHGPRVAAMMITYPSTHGVYEPDVQHVCEAVHAVGAQVYIDGANLNALIGLAQPGAFGCDVSHLNLHKTFCIPHGGGGPGVGPVAVREHLAPFLPADPIAVAEGRQKEGDPVGTPVSATRYGSAGVLPISWAYIKLMGPRGLRSATEHALLSANYVAKRLVPHFPVLYTGPGGLVAHECIVDLRPLTAATGVKAEDIAKRLIDYGFHAPTIAFPVAGTMMVEPTESEDLAELDRFIEAMIAIRAEIEQIADGSIPYQDSPLHRAPHTAAAVASDTWDRPYSRKVAAFPLPGLQADKFFPPVGRIDGAHGDRHLVCICPPPEAFAAEEEQ